MTSTLRERFDAKWIPEPMTGCWLWTGQLNAYGYGTIWRDGSPNQKAHRLSWELNRGPIPPGGHVLHRCDTPLCVNPLHLFLGTQTDNMSDMRKKGRGAKGETHGHARLASAEVRQIRMLSQVGVKQCEMAKAFGVSEAAISNTVHRKNWTA